MKKLFLLFIAISVLGQAGAQDTTRVQGKEKEVVTVREDSTGTVVKVGEKNVVTITEDSTATVVKVGDKEIIVVEDPPEGDTLKIRIGNRTVKVVENEEGTSVRTSREPVHEKYRRRFNGHWSGMELGVNTFLKSSYDLYRGTSFENNEFFDLNYGKSLTFNLNIAEFAFSNERNTAGFVSGLGFRFSDYCFDQPVSIKKEAASGLLIPFTPEETVKKSKLSVAYFTLPLILEIATPLKFDHNPLTLAAGVIGGVNIGSHTKIKFSGNKEKEKRNFNINPFTYELTGRLGLGEFCLFANYSMIPLFRDGKGPELYPLTIGISFPNVSF